MHPTPAAPRPWEPRLRRTAWWPRGPRAAASLRGRRGDAWPLPPFAPSPAERSRSRPARPLSPPSRRTARDLPPPPPASAAAGPAAARPIWISTIQSEPTRTSRPVPVSPAPSRTSTSSSSRARRTRRWCASASSRLARCPTTALPGEMSTLIPVIPGIPGFPRATRPPAGIHSLLDQVESAAAERLAELRRPRSAPYRRRSRDLRPREHRAIDGSNAVLAVRRMLERIRSAGPASGARAPGVAFQKFDPVRDPVAVGIPEADPVGFGIGLDPDGA